MSALQASVGGYTVRSGDYLNDLLTAASGRMEAPEQDPYQALARERGERIKLLREQVYPGKLSRERLAHDLGVSVHSIGKWERGQDAPTVDNLVALAKCLRTTPEYLVRGSLGEEVSGLAERIERLEEMLRELLEARPA